MNMTSEYVRFLRMALDLTQKEFSDRIGYSKVYVGYVEMGTRKITPQYEKSVRAAFNLTDEEVMASQILFSKQRKLKAGVQYVN